VGDSHEKFINLTRFAIGLSSLPISFYIGSLIDNSAFYLPPSQGDQWNYSIFTGMVRLVQLENALIIVSLFLSLLWIIDKTTIDLKFKVSGLLVIGMLNLTSFLGGYILPFATGGNSHIGVLKMDGKTYKLSEWGGWSGMLSVWECQESGTEWSYPALVDS
jgi:hypothetical protein